MGRAYSLNGEKRNANMVLVGNSERKRPLEERDLGGWIILRSIFEK
jgi:hypothetical protein